MSLLYHYKRKRGTTTISVRDCISFTIIPLQEKKGNYDAQHVPDTAPGIIPLQEKKGNYDTDRRDLWHSTIIPLQEEIGKSYLDSLISVCAETSRAIINVVLIRSQHLLPTFKNVPMG